MKINEVRLILKTLRVSQSMLTFPVTLLDAPTLNTCSRNEGDLRIELIISCRCVLVLSLDV